MSRSARSRQDASRPPRLSGPRAPASATTSASVDTAPTRPIAQSLIRWAIERVGRVLREKIRPQRILVVDDTPKHIDAGCVVGAVTFVAKP